MAKAKMNKEMYDFCKCISAPDGYVVEFAGKDYRDELNSLQMVLNDYDGYEIVEISQTKGKKARLHFLLKDK